MKTVLVVEDEFSLQKVLARALEASGFSVRVAGDGDEALAALGRGDVDLVLSDSMLPGFGGVELLRKARSTPSLAHVPFVLMLAAHEAQDEVSVPVLKKPFLTSTLLAAVREALGAGEP